MPARTPGAVSLLLGIVVTIVSVFLPDLLLHGRGQERSQQVALELQTRSIGWPSPSRPARLRLGDDPRQDRTARVPWLRSWPAPLGHPGRPYSTPTLSTRWPPAPGFRICASRPRHHRARRVRHPGRRRTADTGRGVRIKHRQHAEEKAITVPVEDDPPVDAVHPSPSCLVVPYSDRCNETSSQRSSSSGASTSFC